MRVLIVVTHLLGTGHLARALTLARAFGEAGHEVLVASGGMPVPHLDRGDVALVQLPPLRSDGADFARLLDGDGAPVSGSLLQARRQMLSAALHDALPDVVITELFPFGRRILREEFTALLDAARQQQPRPQVCASVRDILAPPSKPEKASQTDALIAQHYDAVLVHSLADVTPLSLSWPVSEALASKLRYTGFVAPPPAPVHPEGVGKDEVIVSAGGGDVGAHVFAAAIAAAAAVGGRRWRLLIGGATAQVRCREIMAAAPANLIAEPARPDFRQMLHHAAASVSLCGYNTALDVLQTGCAAVFVPFDDANEVEQGLRADALSRLPGIATLRRADLTGATLLGALAQVTSATPRAPMHDGFDGAQATVRIVAGLREGMA